MKLSKKKANFDFKLLVKLYFIFFKIGAVTFGGGLAMLPILERELVDRLNWTTREKLSDYYAISQVTPGIIAVNVATFLGFNLLGIIGGIVSTLGVVTPSVIIISVIAFFIEKFSEIEFVKAAFAGINVAVCSLITVSVIKFFKNGLKACNVFLAIFLMILSFVLIAICHIPSAFVIILAAILGIVIYVIANRKELKEKNKK